MKTSIALPLLCAAALAATPNLAAQTAGWQPLLVDPVGDPYDFRSFVSLAFTNASGSPVLAYSDYAHGRMKLASWTGSTWAFETGGKDYGAVSLAMNASDQPSFAWANGGLNFSAKSGNRWSTTTLDRGNVSRYTAPSLAYNASGPAISYRWNNSTIEGLKFAWRTGSTWKTQLVDGRAAGAYWTWDGFSSLAFDPTNGLPTIAYTDDTNDDAAIETLKLAKSTGTAWTITTVEQSILNYSGFCSLAFDSARRPVIADCANGSIRLLRQRADGAWTVQIVDSGSACDLSVNLSNNRADIAYRTSGRLAVASATLDLDPGVPAIWTLQVADFAAPGSSKPAMRPGSNQTPHVAYFGGTELRLIKQNPN